MICGECELYSPCNEYRSRGGDPQNLCPYEEGKGISEENMPKAIEMVRDTYRKWGFGK